MVWYTDFNYFINEKNKWKSFRLRIKYAWKILTGKYIRFNGEAIYFDWEHLKTIKEALEEGYNHIKEYQEKEKNKFQTIQKKTNFGKIGSSKKGGK